MATTHAPRAADNVPTARGVAVASSAAAATVISVVVGRAASTANRIRRDRYARPFADAFARAVPPTRAPRASRSKPFRFAPRTSSAPRETLSRARRPHRSRIASARGAVAALVARSSFEQVAKIPDDVSRRKKIPSFFVVAGPPAENWPRGMPTLHYILCHNHEAQKQCLCRSYKLQSRGSLMG